MIERLRTITVILVEAFVCCSGTSRVVSAAWAGGNRRHLDRDKLRKQGSGHTRGTSFGLSARHDNTISLATSAWEFQAVGRQPSRGRQLCSCGDSRSNCSSDYVDPSLIPRERGKLWLVSRRSQLFGQDIYFARDAGVA